jgi:ATP-dependent protease ClpP protease subunit
MGKKNIIRADENNPELINSESDQQVIAIQTTSNIDTSCRDNKVYFYTEVNKETVLNACKQIDEISKNLKLLEFTYNLPSTPPIELHINSEGGEINSAMILVDKIVSSKIPIHTYSEGLVASAASLFSVVGHKRFISKNSVILIHQLSSVAFGNYNQIIDEKVNLDLCMKLIKNVYLKYTKMKDKELDELLKHDLFLESNECLKKGLVDIVI